MNKTLKKLLMTSAAFLALAGVSATAQVPKNAHASLAEATIRYVNGRDNHCYYVTDHGFEKGILPRMFRRRGTRVIVRDYDNAEPQKITPKRIHGQKYYFDDYDAIVSPHQEFFINTKDIYRNYIGRDKKLFKINRAKIRRNKRMIRHHHNNKKLVQKLMDENNELSFPQYIYNLNKEQHFHE